MKILHINNYHYARGGADKYFLNVVNLLRAKGVEAYSYSPSGTRDEVTQYRYRETVPSIPTEIFSIGAICHYFFSLSHRRAVGAALKEIQPDIVHLHLFHGQISGSVIRHLAGSSAQIVQTLHDHKTICPVGTALRNGKPCTECKEFGRHRAIINRCHKGSYRRSLLIAAEDKFTSSLGYPNNLVDRFICVSDYLAATVQEFGGLDPRVIRVVPNFTHVPKETHHRRRGVLFVGRVERQKGITTLIQAFSKAQLESDEMLHIAGEGPFLAHAKRLVKEAGLVSRVHFYGHCDNKKLDSLYSSVKLFVNPSEYAETFGLATIEAMAHGTVTAATSLGASSEIIGRDAAQFLFTPGDSDALAAILRRVLSGEGCQKRWGPYFRSRVEEKYSPDRHFEVLMNVYQELLRG